MRVLGYDGRLPRGRLATLWDGARRRQFLLRPDTEAPLSVDPMIWPSLVIGSDTDYQHALASRREQVRTALQGREAEYVAITEGDEPIESADWILLGWDIAGPGLVSGIANNAKDAEQWRPVRRRWVDEMNDHGLFTDYGAADECLSEVARLIPEHTPFSVYGLWLWEP